MTPSEIAKKILVRASTKARYPSLFQDELAKEIAHAISEERELLSRYLSFLNESIGFEPNLVRHRLLVGSARISTGRFIEEMNSDEHRKYALRLNTVHRAYYGRE
jgi:hypothetical protein